MTPTLEDRVEAAAAEYLQAVDRGVAPDRTEFLSRYPDLAAELSEFLDDLARFHVVSTPRALETPVDPAATATFDGKRTASTPESPVRIVGYEILGEVGRGGMGIVYKARQLSINRLVALKTISPDRLGTREERDRFLREAEAAATLDHPNIVPIYEVGESDGRSYFTMKLVEGGSLADCRKKYLSDPRGAAELVARVARAVHYAHQRGILHRDLKPSNVLLGASGEPMVADFGLAKRMDGTGDASKSGVIVGTPSYMAPEQARGDKGISTAADVYGLGAVLYQLLTSSPPFLAASAAETLVLVLAGNPSPPRTRNSLLHPDLDAICLKCLTLDPQNRYGTAEALAEDLERWLRGETTSARPATPAERLWKWIRRNPAAALVSAVILLAVATVFVSLVVSNQLIDKALAQKTDALQQAQTNETAALDALGRERTALTEKDAALQDREAALRDRTKAANELASALKLERRTAYQRGIFVVERDRQANRLGAAAKLLEMLKPDVRGWEWEYLRNQCRPQPLSSYDGTPLAMVASSRADAPAIIVARRLPDAKSWEIKSINGAPGADFRAGFDDYSSVSETTVSGDGKWIARVRITRHKREADDRSQNLTNAAITVYPTTEASPICSIPEFERVNMVSRVWFSDDRSRLCVIVSRLVAKNEKAPAGPQQELSIWQLPGGNLVTRYLCPSGIVFRPDGRQFLAGNSVYDADTGRLLLTKTGTTFGSATFRSDGQRVASTDADVIRIWDTTNWEAIRIFPKTGVRALAYSKDGARLAVGLRDGTVQIVDSDTGVELNTIRTADNSTFWLAFDPTGRFLATGRVSMPGEVTVTDSVSIWDLLIRQEARVIKGLSRRGNGPTVCFHPSGRYVASASDQGEVVLWDAITGEIHRQLKGYSSGAAIYDAAISPDGTYLAAAANAGTWLWNLKTDDAPVKVTVPEEMLSRRESWTGRVSFDADSRRLAVAFDHGTLVYDLIAQKALYTIDNKKWSYWSADLAFSPDGTQLLSADRAAYGPPLRLWEASNGQEQKRLTARRGQVYTVRWMRDGKRFASCDSAGKVYIQALDGTVLQEFEGHVQTVYDIALSPDEQRLATASTDGTVRVWDVESGAELLTLTGTGKTFYSVAFSPDGGLLAATADNGTLWIWDGRREAPLELAEVKKADLVYDLGSGDGRIVIAAARLGSTAVGVEWDKDLVKESLAKAKEAGVEKLATFEHGDLFEADFSKADVVAVYILPTMLKKLTPKLNKLKAGSRIVSHAFAIPGVKPARVVEFTSEEDDISRKLYLYTVPLVEDKR